MTQTLSPRSVSPRSAPSTEASDGADGSVTRRYLGHVHPFLTLSTVVALGLAVVGITLGASALATDPDEPESPAQTQTADAAEAPAPVGDVLPDLVPKAELAPAPADEVNVSYAPAVPPAAERATPAIVEVHFEVVENVAAIDPATGTEYETWGYRLVGDGQDVSIGTPGPLIRARVGDLLRFTLTNPAGNTHPHNVDFHAVTGQGGGAADTVVAPGETRTIEARLLYPGVFMYHCAYGDVPLHIAHGMSGGILVDPESPLPQVDHEWYVVQSEYYTDGTTGALADTDRAAVSAEEPTTVVFNGAVGSLVDDGALRMAVGERSRFYFVNAGLNLDSNFHPIGSHWDVVYQEAALLSPPIRGSQTTLVPAGGGVVAELVGQVPSTIILVDHALVRTFDKGAMGQVVVEGEPNAEIFEVVDSATDEGAAAEAGGAADAEEAETVTDDVTPAADGPALSIVAGSGDYQPEGAADEFADGENPADYSVNVLTVEVGTTVTWTNDDAVLHTVTAVDGSFDSGMLAQGETWTHTFDAAGEYEYLCTPHPWMRARIVVEEA